MEMSSKVMSAAGKKERRSQPVNILTNGVPVMYARLRMCS